MPKKKDSPGKLIDERFDTLENKIDKLDTRVGNLETKVDDGFKTLLKMHFDLESKVDSLKEEMNEKFDKVLSGIDKILVKSTAQEQELIVLSARQRDHEDRLSILEG
jgi:chaperonin cofactor prefoldin